MASIPESHRGIIERSQVVHLGTIGPEGEPQITALWYVIEDDTIKMSINSARQKMKNLMRNPYASAFFADPENPYRTIELRGQVSIESDADYALGDQIGARYNSDLRTMDKPGETRMAVTLKPEKVITFGQ